MDNINLKTSICKLPSLVLNRRRYEKVIIQRSFCPDNEQHRIILTINTIQSHKIFCCIETQGKLHYEGISSGIPYFLPGIDDGFIIYSPHITPSKLKIWYDKAEESNHFQSMATSQARIVFKMPVHYSIMRNELLERDDEI